MRIVLLGVLSILTVIAVSVSHGSAPVNPSVAEIGPGQPVAGLQLTLDQAAKGALRVTFENVGNTPTFLNLGIMVGNGRILIPNQLELVVTDPTGNPRKLQVKGVPGVAGRVDDFLVPLMPGAKYTIPFSLDDFVSETGKATVAPGEKLQAHYQGVAPSNPNGANIPALPVWIGEIQSSMVRYAD